jgi:vitamin B12/bleomycin/antimicrobial peptide transport system ATP-binding/permease protein
MRLLAFAVGVFALATFLVGLRAPDAAIFMLAGAALACAATTFLSQRMSIFLKVFNAIFAVETIIFGLAFLVDRLGFWPKAYADYTLPDSLPFAVALFGCLTYALSFIPVVRKMTDIADPYFDNSLPTRARIWPLAPFTVAENKLAKAALVFLIVINQMQVAIEVRLSFYSRDFYNALQNKDLPEFWHQLIYVFLPFASLYVASVVIEYFVTSTFVIRWRRWLSANYIGRWLRGGTHYNMALAGAPSDNPDQRISEDIYGFIYGGGSGTGIYGYSVTILATLTSLVSFAIVLWGLSANFTLPGTNLLIPGFLFWVALIYAGLGTGVTHWIGRPLVRLFFSQQRYEADFRFDLARLREYSEQIALLHGEDAETARAMEKFSNIYGNYMRIVNVRKRLRVFTEAYNLASQYIPFIVGAPFYFLGKIQLGVLLQMARAFSNVNSSLTFFVSSYIGLADFKAVLNRLTSFDEAIDRARALKTQEPRVKLASSPDGDFKIAGLNLNLPGGQALAEIGKLDLAAGQPTLLVGPSGVGKSTLFRAVAGVWPFGEGQIAEPKASLMLLPQRPYIPLGTLRSAIAYPAPAAKYTDKSMREALLTVGLPHLVDRLDDSDNWQMQLSGGEQQRLAVARALAAAPDWLFLDEATSALDEASETQIYNAIARTLPKTTLVSTGHRSTLSAFHKRRIELQPHAGGPATVREVEA